MNAKRIVLRNSFFSSVALIITTLLAFVTRRFFTLFLGEEYLGYNGLFSNIFSVLSLTESGFAASILFLLYKEYSDENWDELSRLMELYKIFYRIVAATTALLGLGTAFFLKYIITGESYEWNYIYVVYLVQLASTVSVFFLNYKRTLFLVAQKQYKYIVVDTICKILLNIGQILVIWLMRSYIVYLLLNVLYNIVANIVVATIFPREFLRIAKTKVSFSYFKEKGFVDNMKAGFVGNMAGIIYGGTDAIVISKLLGIPTVGLYSNYLFVIAGVQQFISSALSGLAPALGKYIYSREYREVERLYRNLNVLYYFVALFVTASYLCLFQPFIRLWLDDSFLISFPTVIAICINQYISWNNGNVYNFRNAWGELRKDRDFYVLSAVGNVIISVVLCQYLGLLGVVIGTIIGHFFILFGRAYVVNTCIIKNDLKRYLITEVVKVLYAVTALTIIYRITIFINTGIVGFVLKGLIVILSMIPVIGIVCFFTEDGRNFGKYVKDMFSNWRERTKQ